MNNYFEHEITTIEKELIRLKTSAQRSAGDIAVLSKTVSFEIPLGLVEPTPGVYFARGNKRYQVTSEKDAVVIPTLDLYCEDISQLWAPWNPVRSIYMRTFRTPDGTLLISVSVEGSVTNYDGITTDVDRLRRGETVTVNVKLTVQSTDEFDLGEYN